MGIFYCCMVGGKGIIIGIELGMVGVKLSMEFDIVFMIFGDCEF